MTAVFELEGPPGPAGPVPAGSGRTYAHHAGVATDGWWTPDDNSLDLTTAIDVRVLAKPDSWAPAAEQVLESKWNTNQQTFRFSLKSGSLLFVYSTTGTNVVTITSDAVLAASILGAGPVWLRANAVANDGTGKAAVTFSYSYDAVTWYVLGAVKTNSTPGPFFSGTARLQTGGTQTAALPYSGRLYEAEVWNPTGPALVARLDARTAAAPPATFTDTTGKVWTPLGTAALLGDEVNDLDFLDKTLRVQRLLPGPNGYILKTIGGATAWGTPTGQVNLLDFCAGDGVTNDTAGFVLAKAAAGVGGRVYVPKPTVAYLIDPFTFDVADQRWDADTGAKITLTSTSSTAVTISADGVRLTGKALLDLTLTSGAGVGMNGYDGELWWTVNAPNSTNAVTVNKSRCKTPCKVIGGKTNGILVNCAASATENLDHVDTSAADVDRSGLASGTAGSCIKYAVADASSYTITSPRNFFYKAKQPPGNHVIAVAFDAHPQYILDGDDGFGETWGGSMGGSVSAAQGGSYFVGSVFHYPTNNGVEIAEALDVTFGPFTVDGQGITARGVTFDGASGPSRNNRAELTVRGCTSEAVKFIGTSSWWCEHNHVDVSVEDCRSGMTRLVYAQWARHNTVHLQGDAAITGGGHVNYAYEWDSSYGGGITGGSVAGLGLGAGYVHGVNAVAMDTMSINAFEMDAGLAMWTFGSLSGGASVGANIRATGCPAYPDILNARDNVIRATGSGPPNNNVTAGVGSTYTDQDGGAGSTLHVKESGANTNTGWVAK